AVLTPALETTLESLRQKLRADEIPYLPKDVRGVVGREGMSVAPAVAGFTTAEVSQTIAGETYWFNADSFFQINADLLESLIEEAIGGASGATAIDLYCGVGLFTLPLARRFERVSAIEVNQRATAFAKKNLERAGLTNAEVITSDVGHWLTEHTASLGPLRTPVRVERNKDQRPTTKDRFVPVDFLLLDPPRTGAENVVIKGLLNLQPQHISYVSCDPATLARDLKKLMANGYEIQSIKAFDMFPQTHHVETIVHLNRSK
ncbi:MAG TPA: methyltransferase, partial [Chthoniobacterales bacterium]